MMNILSVFQTQPSPNLIVFFGSSTLGMTCVVSEVPLIDCGMLECTMTTDLLRPIGFRCCRYQLA
jgi:hypothetical protein